MSNHALFQRAGFQARRVFTKLTLEPDLPGISVLLVTWNRAKFLDLALRALCDTLPDEHDVLLWDNASQDDTPHVVEKWNRSRLHLTTTFSAKNIGTNGFAALALKARREILFEMDDDILLLPKGWSGKIAQAFRDFPEYKYIALDVVQDRFTHGAKPLPVHYESETRGSTTLEYGPTGGWATATLRPFYFSTEGFPYRPHKPYFPEDGYYNRHVRERGMKAGILAGVKAYHAAGANWNKAFGYYRLVTEKHASPGAGKSVGLTFPDVSDEIPSPELIEKIRAEQF
ncbi:glycosyltransferase [bacterium]|nr:glycosyltransferase [bacterium]